MLQRKWLIGGAALALLGIVVLVRGFWTTDGVAARTQGQARPVPVETATVERKTLPVQIRALGTVTPIAAVAIKTQVDTTITSVRFLDGARVEKGDELFTLDCRQIEADMMTTFAAIFGTIPIALGTGAGAELRQPLGVAVVGGLVLSQLLTLYITPVIYLYLDRFDRMLKRRLEPQLQEVEEAPPAVAAE